MFTLNFKHCKVMVWPNQKCMVTIFEDGAELPAAPNFRDEDFELANKLGYGSNTWLMTYEHELTHTGLAERRGWPYSAALWSAAHPGEPYPDFAKEITWDVEEEEVLKAQFMANFARDVRQKLENDN